MSYLITVLAEVSEEVNEASLYYEKLQAGLGIRLIDDWDDALSPILKSPHGYQKHKRHYRYIQLRRFPYTVIYEVHLSLIVVYRLIHVKKHPRKRYSRRKK